MTFIRKIKVGNCVYLAEVKSVREGKKVRQKFIRYVGREIDGKTVLSSTMTDISVSNVKVHGPLLVLNSLAEKIGLHEILGEYSAELLSMIYSHCINPKSINKMQDWFAKTDLNRLLNLEGLTEKRVAGAFESIGSYDKIEFIQEKIFKSIKSEFKLDEENYFYDLTNVYFFGSDCKIAKRGKSKEGGFKKIVQIGLSTTKQGIPVFHRTFPGNVFDSRSLFELLRAFKDYGIKNTFLVWDRGISSKININDAKDMGFNVLCGLAIKGKLSLEIDSILKNNKITLPKNRVQLQNTSIYVIAKRFTYDKTKGYLYVCLNRQTRVQKQERRLLKISKAQKRFNEDKKIPLNLEKYINKRGKIIAQAVSLAEKSDGFSLLFSTKKIDSAEAIKRYFEKDVVEKAFQCLKGVVKVRPIRMWLEKNVRAHIFICYLSYLLLSTLNLVIKEKGMDLSPNGALEQLEGMYKIYFLNEKTKTTFTKTVTLTKQQQNILKAVDKKLLKCSD